MGNLKCFMFLAQISMVFWRIVVCDDEVTQAFVEYGVVPDVVSIPPPALAEVIYSSAQVMLGNELLLTQVLVAPKYVFWDADPNGYYTLAMVDPDVISRKAPLLREFLHWLVVNIRGCDVDSGNTLAPYVPPIPPPGTGLHRYVFLVYRQCCAVGNKELLFINRTLFSIEDYARRNNLEGPIAGNFFQSQFALTESKNIYVGPVSLAIPNL